MAMVITTTTTTTKEAAVLNCTRFRNFVGKVKTKKAKVRTKWVKVKTLSCNIAGEVKTFFEDKIEVFRVHLYCFYFKKNDFFRPK